MVVIQISRSEILGSLAGIYNPSYAPCYCSPADGSGISACFDFNAATSDVSCNPTGLCALSTAQPGAYGIQLGGPVYLVSRNVTEVFLATNTVVIPPLSKATPDID